MTWVKLDDQFFTHPKALAAGRDGRTLYIVGLCYASANLTDGKIPKPALPIIASMAGVRPACAEAVVATGLWSDQGDAYEIHDYLEHQQSKERVEAERTKAKQRKERWMERQRNARGNGVPHARENAKTADVEEEGEVEVDLGHRQSQGSRGAPPTVDDDLELVLQTIASRKLKLKLDRGEQIEVSETAWLAKVISHDRDRLRARHRLEHGKHPDWTTERMADELDPETAESDHRILDADATAARTAKQREEAAQAVPMSAEAKADALAETRARARAGARVNKRRSR